MDARLRAILRELRSFSWTTDLSVWEREAFVRGLIKISGDGKHSAWADGSNRLWQVFTDNNRLTRVEIELESDSRTSTPVGWQELVEATNLALGANVPEGSVIQDDARAKSARWPLKSGAHLILRAVSTETQPQRLALTVLVGQT